MEKQALTVFEHEHFGKVRTLVIDGEPWAVARDVATALGYDEPHKAVQRHCKKAKNLNNSNRDVLSPLVSSKVPPPKIIPESDIFRLIMRSNLPAAEIFQDWVCEEVLPSIRKTGAYKIPTIATTTQELDASIQMAKLLGYAGNQAILVGVRAIKKRYNVDVLELTGTPRPTTERQDHFLTPTDVGAPFGLSGHAVNRELERLGLQKNVHEVGAPASWILSDVGHEYGCYLNEARSDMTLVRKIYWFPLVSELIQAKVIQN